MIAVRTKFPVLLMIFCFGLIGLSCQTFSRLTSGGGTVFTIEIETDAANRGEIVERAIKIIEGKFGSIKSRGEVARIPGKENQISVKIYGSNNNWEALKKFLFTSYQLELKKVVSPPSPAPLQTYLTEEEARQIAAKDQEVLPYLDRRESAVQRFIIVEKKPIVTGEDVRDAEAFPRTKSKDDFSIYFSLKPEGAVKLGDWTGKNINNYIAVILDKEVQSAAYIKSQIFDNGEITGRFTREEAENIALSLKSGYLPAKMKIIEEKTFKN